MYLSPQSAFLVSCSRYSCLLEMKAQCSDSFLSWVKQLGWLLWRNSYQRTLLSQLPSMRHRLVPTNLSTILKSDPMPRCISDSTKAILPSPSSRSDRWTQCP
jgi:hypothetical protein